MTTGLDARLDRLETIVNTTALSLATLTETVRGLAEAQARTQAAQDAFVLREVYEADRRLAAVHEASLADIEERQRRCEHQRQGFVTRQTLWLFAAGIVTATGTVVGIVERVTA